MSVPETLPARLPEGGPEAASDGPTVPAGGAGRFEMFVILADMRTGSNFLEANLNAVPGLRSWAEPFNPVFVGEPGRDGLLGVSLAEREADPAALLRAIRAEPGLNGFRLFSDHDPRALDLVLPDPRVAKVVLTRNPAESWASLEMARATDRWRLFNPSHATFARVRWDPASFRAHLDRLQAWQLRILKGLQRTGQTAFFLDYEDLQDLEAVNGLLLWLGVEGRLGHLDRRLKKQNPEPLSEKVENFAEMEAALGGTLGGPDRLDLGRTPNFEPRRGPAAPAALASAAAPLLFLPLAAGPVAAVRGWLAALGDAPRDPRDSRDAPGLVEGFDPRALRRWKADRPGHLSFTVLRHPLARAHAAFCERILPPDLLPEVRANMRRTFQLPVPEEGVDLACPAAAEAWDDMSHRRAFVRFLQLLKHLVAGQSSIRPDPAWASQVALVGGLSAWPPDLVLREERLGGELRALAARVGVRGAPALGPTDPHEDRLRAIHGPDLDALARAAVSKDYVAWGFRDWRPSRRP